MKTRCLKTSGENLTDTATLEYNLVSSRKGEDKHTSSPSKCS